MVRGAGSAVAVVGLMMLPLLAACASSSPSPSSSSPSSPSPSSQPGSLFGEAGEDGTTASGSPAGALRSRTTTFASDLLLDGTGAERVGPIEVRFNVFPDVQPLVTLTLARDPSITTWSGTLPSGMPGEARVVRVAASFMVSLTVGLRRFEASRLPDGTYRVIEIDPAGGRPD